jgi:hypothetical protein
MDMQDRWEARGEAYAGDKRARDKEYRAKDTYT